MILDFGGKDAYWWLINVQQHFEAVGILEEEKIKMVGKAMRARASIWWYVWKKDHPNASWWDFVKALLKEFQPEYDPDLFVWDDDEGSLMQESIKENEDLKNKEDKMQNESLKIKNLNCNNGEEANLVEAKTEAKLEFLALKNENQDLSLSQDEKMKFSKDKHLEQKIDKEQQKEMTKVEEEIKNIEKDLWVGKGVVRLGADQISDFEGVEGHWKQEKRGGNPVLFDLGGIYFNSPENLPSTSSIGWAIYVQQWDPGGTSSIAWVIYVQQWDPGGIVFNKYHLVEIGH